MPILYIDFFTCEGIVLEAVDGMRAFRRFGMLTIYREARDLLERAHEAFHTFAQELRLGFIEDEEDKKLYTITIV
jgi:hypothetical protein